MASENIKRIAKNTLMLYFRMLLIMAVSLYTVRVVLKTLGVVDYGINNVVAGVVVMFSFISSTMSSAAQRFFAFEIGQNNLQQLKKLFSLTVTIYFLIGLVFLVFAETLGYWFLNNYLLIPHSRIEAANWIYQFSVISFFYTLLTIPYEASIIAHEDMKIFAYISVLEAFLKLALVYVLYIVDFDKLKLYGVMTFITSYLIRFIYRRICRYKYTECRYKFFWDKKLFRTIMSYSGWNLFGAISSVLKNHGINIMLNLFYGPIVNASRAIAFQVNNTINQFATNFFTAINPQITKSFAAGERERMISMIFQSSRLSYLLLFILSMPLLLETNFIMNLWLNVVPQYTIIFTRIVIVTSLIDSLSNSLIAAALATGKIKKYHLYVGGLILLNLPLSFVLLKIGYPPQVTMYINGIISFSSIFVRLVVLRDLIGISISDYANSVLKRIIIVSTISYVVPIVLLEIMNESIIRSIIVNISGLCVCVISIILWGLTKSERIFILQSIKHAITGRSKIGVFSEKLD